MAVHLTRKEIENVCDNAILTGKMSGDTAIVVLNLLDRVQELEAEVRHLNDPKRLRITATPRRRT